MHMLWVCDNLFCKYFLSFFAAAGAAVCCLFSRRMYNVCRYSNSESFFQLFRHLSLISCSQVFTKSREEKKHTNNFNVFLKNVCTRYSTQPHRVVNFSSKEETTIFLYVENNFINNSNFIIFSSCKKVFTYFWMKKISNFMLTEENIYQRIWREFCSMKTLSLQKRWRKESMKIFRSRKEHLIESLIRSSDRSATFASNHNLLNDNFL